MKYTEEKREELAAELRQWWEDRARLNTWGIKFSKEFIDERMSAWHNIFDELQKEEQNT